MATFRQGDTTTITITSDVAIGDDKKIKAGLYDIVNDVFYTNNGT